jgi:hypothetical protein
MNAARARILAALSITSGVTIGQISGIADDALVRQPPRIYSDPGHYPVKHSPDRMLGQLAKAPEVSLLRGAAGKPLFEKPEDPHPVLAEFDKRSDLRGLPVIRGAECELTTIEAKHFAAASSSFRGLFATLSEGFERKKVDWKLVNSNLNESIVEANGALILQMLQCERPQFRSLLNQRLALSSGPVATKALAHRCVFELDADRRDEAVRLLKPQVSAAARQFLLDALRYPYAPFADHAAAALICFRDRDALSSLVALLDAPDPVSPMSDKDGNIKIAEVVRINHARNCQLCHAPSWNAKDPIRVAVPSVSAPLPPPFSIAYYSDAGRGETVRADVTYLRQDFSLVLPVPEPGQWPKMQRFDFLIRQRDAFPWELEKKWSNIDYPQRYAVLRVLRAITNRDFGLESKAWREGIRKDGRFSGLVTSPLGGH